MVSAIWFHHFYTLNLINYLTYLCAKSTNFQYSFCGKSDSQNFFGECINRSRREKNVKCHKEDAPLLGLMGQSMRLIGKRAQELYAEYDLNRAQSGKELAKRLNVTPPSITSMIKKMEQEGYITRKADEQDQRVMRLTLAQKGRDSIAYVIKTAEKLEEKVFEGMSAEEKMLFRRLLLQIIENVE